MSYEYIEEHWCEVCGAIDTDPNQHKCPNCRPCSGCYAPGSEECDLCPDSDECESDYINRMD